MREKMKAKYIKEYIQKFFGKLAGWHLVTSQRINLFTDNFQGFWLNEHLAMAILLFLIQNTWKVFVKLLLYVLAKILSL